MEILLHYIDPKDDPVLGDEHNPTGGDFGDTHEGNDGSFSSGQGSGSGEGSGGTYPN